MYRPDHFKVDDLDTLVQLMAEYPLASLVSGTADGTADGQPFASHVPLLVRLGTTDSGQDKVTLAGHLARDNPQWHHWDGAREALAIFNGPGAYVSPAWYGEHPSVPTWNYATVQALGCPQIIKDAEAVLAILQDLVVAAEAQRAEPWVMNLPPDYQMQMMAGIVAFEMPVMRLEGKCKLSQNRTPADREGVIAALEADSDLGNQELGAFMRRQRNIVFGVGLNRKSPHPEQQTEPTVTATAPSRGKT